MTDALTGGVCEVDALNHDGAGVGRCAGKVVFIEGALPGEEVDFGYRGRKPRYDRAVMHALRRASPDRVTPPCAHFGVCGGCRLQHLASSAQRTAKAEIVRATLSHVGGVAPEHWAEPLAGAVWGYRRKARLGVRVVPKKGGVLVGFRERAHSFITPLTVCHTLMPALGERLADLTALIAELSCPERIPQIEFAAGDDTAALVFRHLVPLTEADRGRLEAFGAAYGFTVYTQAAGPDTLVRLGPEGAPLCYHLPAFALAMRFAPTDFVQVHAEVNREMVAQAVEWLAPGPAERILDLFSGIGNFALPLARSADCVLGVEGVAALTERARANAAANGLANTDWETRDLVAGDLAGLARDFHADAALLDPPRTGALEVVTALAEAEVARVCYVSCNPATLARDSAILVHRYGYRLARAGVVDMFPHTHHIETMCLFTREP